MSTTFYSLGLDNWSSSYKGNRIVGLVLSDQQSENNFPSLSPSVCPLRTTHVGILLLNLTNQFKDKHLESAYQRYSQRQRQKSLVILNIIDIVLKAIFLVAYFIAESEQLSSLESSQQQGDGLVGTNSSSSSTWLGMWH